MLKQLFFLFVLTLLNTVFYAQYLVSCDYLGLSSSSVLSGATGLSLNNDVKMYKLTYNTIDTDSVPIIATGAFLLQITHPALIFP